jgi:N-acetylglucosaminyl-diphospho-decaprenol L-rhamnosyltransferase
LLAVIIVTWNVKDLVLDALGTLYADLERSRLSAQVYVVDSASTDGTPAAIRAAFPQVDLHASPENLGFGRGNNHAIHRAMAAETPPSAVYLLNPDTRTIPGATETLYRALLADATCGMVGARLSYGDGSFQHGAFAFPGLRQLWVEFFPTPGRLINSRFNGRYPRASYASGAAFPVDFTLGATMMIRPEVITQTGGFDEDFFMYCEEIDWAWRMHQAGWTVKCVPTAHIVHLSGQSASQVRPQSTLYLWQSRLRLFRKHYPAWKRKLAHRLIVAGMRRKITATQTDSTLSPADRVAMVETYQTVIQLAKDAP